MVEPNRQRGDDDHRPVIGRPLLEPNGDPTPLLEPVDAAFDDVAAAVGCLVERGCAVGTRGPACALIAALGDDVSDAPAPQEQAAAVIAVALGGEQAVGTRARSLPSAGSRSGRHLSASWRRCQARRSIPECRSSLVPSSIRRSHGRWQALRGGVLATGASATRAPRRLGADTTAGA